MTAKAANRSSHRSAHARRPSGLELESDHASRGQAIAFIAAKIARPAATLHQEVRQADKESGRTKKGRGLCRALEGLILSSQSSDLRV